MIHTNRQYLVVGLDQPPTLQQGVGQHGDHSAVRPLAVSTTSVRSRFEGERLGFLFDSHGTSGVEWMTWTSWPLASSSAFKNLRSRVKTSAPDGSPVGPAKIFSLGGNFVRSAAIYSGMAIDPTNDDSLIDDALQRVSRGETAAFEVILRRFERPLRAWLAAHVPLGVDVDEIAQRSFVAAFSRLNEYQPGTNFIAWLFTIARYQLRTETTRLRRIADYHARYGPDLLQRELDRRCEESPEKETMRLDHLQRCLDTLGDHLRRFLTWRYDEEIPLDEMATRCGRSVPAVKKQLWKIRQTLQQCIENRIAAAEERS